MGNVKELNIKNQTYYFFDDMIDIRNFHSNLLKIDKKPYKDFDIYYIGYITIKKFDKFSDHENIHSVNPLYLIFHSATGYFKEENGGKYLIIDSAEIFFSSIRSEIQTINNGEKLFYGEDYVKNGVDTDDKIPLDKKVKLPSLIIIIRLVFQNDENLYPQIYLDECLYEL